jgi:N-methylhydantoinase A
MLRVPIARADIDREDLQAAFEDAYFHRFDLRLPEVRAVLVTLHTAVIGRRPQVSLNSLMDAAARADSVEAATVGRRQVWFTDGWHDTPIMHREKLPLRASFAGPAIVEQLDTTTVIEPGNTVEVDAVGNLIVTVPPAFREA